MIVPTHIWSLALSVLNLVSRVALSDSSFKSRLPGKSAKYSSWNCRQILDIRFSLDFCEKRTEHCFSLTTDLEKNLTINFHHNKNLNRNLKISLMMKINCKIFLWKGQLVSKKKKDRSNFSFIQLCFCGIILRNVCLAFASNPLCKEKQCFEEEIPIRSQKTGAILSLSSCFFGGILQ